MASWTDFADFGPTPTEGDLLDLEASMGRRLPADYRDFLSCFNGACLTGGWVEVPGLKGSPTDVHALLGIGRPELTENLSWAREALGPRLPGDRDLLPIGKDSLGCPFCLDLGPGDAGRIVFADLLDASGVKLYPVAATFAEFVERVTVVG